MEIVVTVQRGSWHHMLTISSYSDGVSGFEAACRVGIMALSPHPDGTLEQRADIGINYADPTLNLLFLLLRATKVVQASQALQESRGPEVHRLVPRDIACPLLFPQMLLYFFFFLKSR